MTVVEIMPESDLDSETVYYESINWALGECKSKETATNTTMDIYFLNHSSHGAGVFGFGGDDSGDVSILSITGIKNNIRTALDNNNVLRFNIIGFDACIMQSWAVLGELSTVTDYILASVALEPGHGWNYAYILSN